MTYTGPGGVFVPHPTDEFLRGVIFGEDGSYWRKGSGDSGLAVVELRGAGNPLVRRVLRDEPALAFCLVEPHGFFFVFFEPGKFVEQLVPFAGGTSRPWVE